MCYVKVERCNSIEMSGNAQLYGSADTRFLGVGATAHTMSHCVKASSSLMREAALVWPDAAHRSPGSDRDGCLSSPVMALLMNGLHCQEKKGKKRAWKPSEDQYVRTGEPASHVKSPHRAAVPPGCHLRCLLHH
ncbi:unnamed protein product [Tetraodon nigroviridis]|uniref:Chromosome 10 SCAF15019, whole genome shotgun sequence n=1 Tax=Tetraodon nigroviridis TaxID=99883 RepID=Q4RLK1_TETNG|nr:unnamed protein product [Tetraodon nigroviridis]